MCENLDLLKEYFYEVARGNLKKIKGYTMNTIETLDISGVTVTINGTSYTYEAHSLTKVSEILGGSALVLTEGAKIDGITINYFTA